MKKTGIFFNEQTVECLCGALQSFEKMQFSKDECGRQSLKFSTDIFKDKIMRFISKHI
jgi:hypothetical protein